MRGPVEINNVLKISKLGGLPREPNREAPVVDLEFSRRFLGDTFTFCDHDEHAHNRGSTNQRVLLVEKILDGEWLYLWHASVIMEEIENPRTSWTCKRTKMYARWYQRQKSIEESPFRTGCFDDTFTSGRLS